MAENDGLTVANLVEAIASGSKPTWAKLVGSRFVGANLAQVDFSSTKLQGMNFAGANLVGAKFEMADLVDANFTEANLAGADFEMADLIRANFTDANLEGADLTVADLTHVNFTGANLSGANLAGATLSKANFSGVRGIASREIELEVIQWIVDKGVEDSPLYQGGWTEWHEMDSRLREVAQSVEELAKKWAAKYPDKVRGVLPDINISTEQIGTALIPSLSDLFLSGTREVEARIALILSGEYPLLDR